MFLDRRVELSLFAIATMLRLHKFGDVHPMLFGKPKWYPPASRDSVANKAWDEVRATGLTDRQGRLDVEFLDILPLLSGGSVEYTAAIKEGEHTRTVLVSSNRAGAIVAVSNGSTAAIGGIRNEYLAETLVRQLPDMRPGGGGTINVALSEVRGLSSGSGSGASGGSSRSSGYTSRNMFNSGSNDLALYRELTSLPRHGEGELSVATRHEGRRTCFEPPIGYFDTSKGRWFVQRTQQRGHEPWIIAAPATTAELTSRLYAAYRTLT